MVLRFLFLFGLAGLSAVAANETPRPNVLVFLVDDMGVMDTSLPGADEGFFETPSLEELARRGMTFRNGYCAHPRCVESRFAIQTGRSPYRDAAQTSDTAKAMAPHPTIGEAFQRAGYATGFFGKWHLGKTAADFPSGRGYETNIGGCHAGAVGSHFFPYHLNARTGKLGKEGPILGLEEGPEGENVTDRLTTECETWIRKQVGDQAGKATADRKPFFAFLSHFAVHTPIQGKPDEVKHFEAKIPGLPPAAGTDGFIAADGQSKSRRDHPIYASMVKTTDDSLGRLLAVLDELDIANDTVVLFTSDHGGLSNRGPESKREVATSNLPYRAGKGHLYEGGLRVPFLVAYPRRVAGGANSDVFAVGTDIFPTLLDFAGIDLLPRHHVDGESLVPALVPGSGELTRKRYFWHHPLPRPTQTGDKAVSIFREGHHKLVKSYFPAEAYELYDLAADPHEQNDIAAEKADRVERMAGVLRDHLVRTGAPDLRQDWKVKDVTAPVAGPDAKAGEKKEKEKKKKPGKRKNILFLAVDDLKPLLGCYGSPLAKTPNMDALAARGFRLDNAHCQWPVCGPSRASLMTSLRPEAVGVMDLSTDMRAKNPDVLTIPQHFRNHGYITAGTGKIYDPRCVDNRRDNDKPSWSIPFRHHHPRRVTEIDGKGAVARAPDVEPTALADGQIAQEGLGLIREMATVDEPFFLAVGFKKPHLAFVAPKACWDRYDPATLTLPEFTGPIADESGYCLHTSMEFRGYGGVRRRGPFPKADQRRWLHGYLACISYVDDLVGQLLAELDRQGLAESTAIVLWGDHGFHLGHQGIWGKHTVLEQSTRSPLFFVAPGLAGGKASNAPVEFTDIFPTLCDLAGVPVPGGLHGHSVVPLWRGEVDGVRKGALSLIERQGAFGYSYRTERYRYIEWVNKFGKAVDADLFDYQTDPDERRSLARDPEHADLIQQLAADLRSEALGCERLLLGLDKE